MTVPAREVRKNWRVNPGTPSEWVVIRSEKVGTLWEVLGRSDEADFQPVMHVPPDQEVFAAPPLRMITVPAMDDETLAWARKAVGSYLPAVSGSGRYWNWLVEVVAAHEREAI